MKNERVKERQLCENEMEFIEIAGKWHKSDHFEADEQTNAIY